MPALVRLIEYLRTTAAARLIQASKLDEDGAVTISTAALALEAKPLLAALGAGD